MITSSTALYCLIGDPVSGSISPQLHNAAYGEMGLDAVYVAFRVPQEGLRAAVEGLRVLSRGFNVTIPHKTRITLLMDSLTQEASLTGAVNTVKVDAGVGSGSPTLIGHNTDALAAVDALDRLGLRGGAATVVGAGGAAKSVVYALWRRSFSTVYILDRQLGRAQGLAAGSETIYGLEAKGMELSDGSLGAALRESSLLVNATPLGMYGEELDVDLRSRPSLAVMDLAYRPGGTALIRAAEANGLKLVGGAEFLALQAAYAIEFWTGRRPSMGVLLKATSDALAAK